MVEQAGLRRTPASESTKPIELDLDDFLSRLKADFTKSLWTFYGNVQDGTVFPDPFRVDRLGHTIRVDSNDALMVTIGNRDIAIAKGVSLGLKPETYLMFGIAEVNRDPATEKLDPENDKNRLEAILNAGKQAVDIHTHGRTLAIGYDNIGSDIPSSLREINQTNPERLITDQGRGMLLNLVAEVLGL